MNCYTILLIIALLLAIANAKRRKVARHRQNCDAAQGAHVATIMSKNELNLNSRGDFVCGDNLRKMKLEMCQIIYDHKEGNPNDLFEKIKKFYMERVYTKENFPITYRPHAKLGTVNETVIDIFYNNNCSRSRQGSMTEALTFLGLLFLTTFALMR